MPISSATPWTQAMGQSSPAPIQKHWENTSINLASRESKHREPPADLGNEDTGQLLGPQRSIGLSVRHPQDHSCAMGPQGHHGYPARHGVTVATAMGTEPALGASEAGGTLRSSDRSPTAKEAAAKPSQVPEPGEATGGWQTMGRTALILNPGEQKGQLGTERSRGWPPAQRIVTGVLTPVPC